MSPQPQRVTWSPAAADGVDTDAEVASVRAAAQPGRAPLAQADGLWLCTAALLALAVAAVLYIARLHFGAWQHEAIQIDELHFATCAARGWAVDQFPVAGCHDNKAPLIYILHQLVQWGSTGIALLRIKVAAFSVVLLIATAAAFTAHRMGGRLAALAAAGLVLLVFAARPDTMALKTETVGWLLSITAIGVALRPQLRIRDVLLCGLLLGLAVMTKQTNALLALVVLVWLLRPAHTLATRSLTRGQRLGYWGLGATLPGAVLLVVYLVQGNAVEFIATAFIHPMVYGPAALPWSLRLSHAGRELLSALALSPLLTTLWAIGLVLLMAQRHRLTAPSPTAQHADRLLVCAWAAVLTTIVLAPRVFAYHLLPLHLWMAMTAAVAVGRIGARTSGPDTATTRWQIGLALLVPALCAVYAVWASNGPDSLQRPRPATLVDGAAVGDYAYVVGSWPHFYGDNGLRPASSVLYPWALRGAPASPMHRLPEPGSLTQRLQSWVLAHAMEQLQDDFRRTPPRYIVLMHVFANQAGAPTAVDIPEIDRYLRAHCHHRPIELVSHWGHASSLYHCTAPPTS
jgi:hypothetical protein